MLFRLLIVTLLLNAKPSHADVKYIATHYSIIPGSEQERDWNKCAEISPSYLEELMRFRELARDLHNLVMGPEYPGRAGDITKMRAELKIHSDRLLLLSKPEWNIQNRRWHLKWTIPGSEFSECNVLGYTAGDIRLLGERRPDLKDWLWVLLDKGRFRDVEVMLSKEATFLEFCQMVRSIEIDFSVDYECPWTFVAPAQKKYKLIFGEDL